MEVVGVVKADAYGHGAIEVSRVLVAEGARWLAVSSVDEGVDSARRPALSAPRILVMGGFLPFEGDGAGGARPYPGRAFADADARSRPAGARLPESRVRYHLKIDSGMGRLGTRAPAAEIAGGSGGHAARANWKG